MFIQQSNFCAAGPMERILWTLCLSCLTWIGLSLIGCSLISQELMSCWCVMVGLPLQWTASVSHRVSLFSYRWQENPKNIIFSFEMMQKCSRLQLKRQFVAAFKFLPLKKPSCKLCEVPSQSAACPHLMSLESLSSIQKLPKNTTLIKCDAGCNMWLSHFGVSQISLVKSIICHCNPDSSDKLL